MAFSGSPTRRKTTIDIPIYEDKPGPSGITHVTQVIKLLFLSLSIIPGVVKGLL